MKYLIAALAVCISMPALAQGQNCHPRQNVLDVLGGKYGETVQSRGLTDNGVMIEMWANDETRTWTAVVTMPNGMSCVVASGGNFERSDTAPEPTGEDM